MTPVNLLLVVGIGITLSVTAFGGSFARAISDTAIRVHDGLHSDSSGSLFKASEFTAVTRDYTMVKPHVSDRTWSVEGVPLQDILNKKFEADPGKLGKTNFVMLRRKQDSGDFLIVPKDLLQNDPPVVLTSKVRDASGEAPVMSPAIVFPAAGEYKDNNRDASEQFELPDAELDMTAAGGDILSVSIKSEKMSDGNYRFSVPKKPSDHGSVTYQWYLYKSDEKMEEHKGTVFKTTKIADSTSKFTAYLYVTTSDDSAGQATKSVTGSKKDDQQTKSPSSVDTSPGQGPTPQSTIPGTTGSGPGSTTGSGPSTYTPPKYNPPSTTIPPPTAATGASNADNSGLSQAVAGLRGTGTARAVSGVLLSTPPTSPNPAAGTSDGRALEKLSTPLANAANNVFKPIQYPDNGWMLMVAVMFAAFILGGVKEYRNP